MSRARSKMLSAKMTAIFSSTSQSCLRAGSARRKTAQRKRTGRPGTKRRMLPRISRALADWISAGARGIGQIEIQRDGAGFVLCHLDDTARQDLEIFRSPNDATELAKFDDEGNYRPLKTAPNLRHGWRLELPDLNALEEALEVFYPGRLAVLAAWEANHL